MSERILVFDTETTGKAFFKLGPDHPSQPYPVQLAAVMFENDREVATLLCLIEPHNWTISKEVSDIHGITEDEARSNGIPLRTAAHAFWWLVSKADLLVAHNVDFDLLVMRTAFSRMQMEDNLVTKPRFCTMRTSTDICQLPGPYGYKWPKLGELYQFAFNEPLVDAHDAMVDLRATWRCYKWLRDRLVTQPLKVALA